jgi:hypothetical protein
MPSAWMCRKMSPEWKNSCRNEAARPTFLAGRFARMEVAFVFTESFAASPTRPLPGLNRW